MDEIVINSGWRETLQELAARRREAWPLFLLVGAVALFAVVVGGGDAPAQIAPPATGADAASPASVPGDPAGSLLVHVAGAVRKPDLYEFPEGARVADAIATAGGPTRRADLDVLNLAEPLVDGTKVLVVEVGEQPAAVGVTGGSPDDSVIPLNTADQAQLESLPGIGPVTATAILEHREEIGAFDSIEQLLDVDGIGPATLDDISSYLIL